MISNSNIRARQATYKREAERRWLRQTTWKKEDVATQPRRLASSDHMAKEGEANHRASSDHMAKEGDAQQPGQLASSDHMGKEGGAPKGASSDHMEKEGDAQQMRAAVRFEKLILETCNTTSLNSNRATALARKAHLQAVQEACLTEAQIAGMKRDAAKKGKAYIGGPTVPEQGKAAAGVRALFLKELAGYPVPKPTITEMQNKVEDIRSCASMRGDAQLHAALYTVGQGLKRDASPQRGQMTCSSSSKSSLKQSSRGRNS